MKKLIGRTKGLWELVCPYLDINWILKERDMTGLSGYKQQLMACTSISSRWVILMLLLVGVAQPEPLRLSV
jgi:hypothetical protein